MCRRRIGQGSFGWGRSGGERASSLDGLHDLIDGGRIEENLGTWKRRYGLRRMRWRGLAKAGLQVRLTAIAYNLKRCLSILAPA